MHSLWFVSLLWKGCIIFVLSLSLRRGAFSLVCLSLLEGVHLVCLSLGKGAFSLVCLSIWEGLPYLCFVSLSLRRGAF